jgi:hypothetical protein
MRALAVTANDIVHTKRKIGHEPQQPSSDLASRGHLLPEREKESRTMKVENKKEERRL